MVVFGLSLLFGAGAGVEVGVVSVMTVGSAVGSVVGVGLRVHV